MKIPSYGPVYVIFSKDSVRNSLIDGQEVVVQELSDTGFHHGSSPFPQAGEGFMGRYEQSQGTSVGTYYAVVSPFFAGYFIQDGVYGHRDTVPGIVGGHKGTGASLCDAFVKGIRIIFTEQPFIKIRGGGIPTVFVAVGHEMLHQRGTFPIAGMISLQSPDKGHGHLSCQVCVLAEAFLGPSPARVPCQVGIGSAHDHAAPGVFTSLCVITYLVCLHFGHFPYQFLIPGGAEAVRLRKGGGRGVFFASPVGRTTQGHAVQTFRVPGIADTQAGHSQVCGQKVDFFFHGKHVQKDVNTHAVGQVFVVEGIILRLKTRNK